NDTWKIFLAAHDINDVVAKGEELGAQFFMPPMPVADMGIQTVFTDANGATLGAWQPLSFPGFMTTDEPGTPCWFELNARDFAAAVNFYTSVFALGTKVMADSDDFRYTTLVADGHEVAGIVDASGRLPEGVASHWVIYWQVDDIDVAVSRVRELGGAVHDGPFDSPFGRIATVVDPTGSMFKLRSSSPE
ncbi:MAG TPA: VOC family protein, partial [Acidimicrobiales bacterium]